jgi:hypothetical protein
MRIYYHSWLLRTCRRSLNLPIEQSPPHIELTEEIDRYITVSSQATDTIHRSPHRPAASSSFSVSSPSPHSPSPAPGRWRRHRIYAVLGAGCRRLDHGKEVGGISAGASGAVDLLEQQGAVACECLRCGWFFAFFDLSPWSFQMRFFPNTSPSFSLSYQEEKQVRSCGD